MSLFSELENRFVARFSSHRRLLSGGVLSESAATSLAPQLVIGRGYCRYLGLELGHVPRSQRNQALNSQLLAYSMWEDDDYCVAWNGSFAQIWFWDRDKVSQQIQQQQPDLQKTGNLRSVWMLAEATLWNKPSEPGLYLYHCKNGYDLQYWMDGNLLASQWYNSEPGREQFRRFMRSQGIEHQQSSPQVVQPTENETPWPGVARPGHVGGESIRQKLVVGSAAVFALVLLLQIIAITRWSFIESNYVSLREDLEESSVSVLEDRTTARQLRDDYDDLAQLFMVPDSLYTQWLVTQRLPEELGLSLIRWERNVDEVEMTVAGEIRDSLSLVQQLNGDERVIRNTTVEDSRINGQTVIRLTINEMPRSEGAVVLSGNAQGNTGNGSNNTNNSGNTEPSQPVSAEEVTPEMFEEMFGVPL